MYRRSYGGCGTRAASWRGPTPMRVSHRQEHWERYRGHDRFFGLDAAEMSPRSQVAASLAVLVPATLLATVVLFQAPWLFWLFFVFGWMVFPAFGLLVRGISGLGGTGKEKVAAGSGERELLEALVRNGELTPARAAMETSLSVKEADEILKELAEGGHLEVRVRGGGLFYALWEPAPAVGEIEG